MKKTQKILLCMIFWMKWSNVVRGQDPAVESGSCCAMGLNYKEYYEKKGLARPYDATVKMLMKIKRLC
jgi:hypothetical protein